MSVPPPPATASPGVQNTLRPLSSAPSPPTHSIEADGVGVMPGEVVVGEGDVGGPLEGGRVS